MNTHRSFLWLLPSLILCINLVSSEEPTTPHMPTGDRDPSPSEEEAFRQSFRRVAQVRPTALALERVNVERRAAGLQDLSMQELQAVESDSEAAVFADPSEGDEQTLNLMWTPAHNLPRQVDNSREIWFPPIRHQSSLNSCAAWAVTYYQMTYEISRMMGWNASTGNNDIIRAPTWTYNFVNDGRNIATVTTDNYRVIQYHGAISWNQQGGHNDARHWCLDPQAWQEALQWRYHSLNYIYFMNEQSGIDNLRQLLANGHVATFSSHVFDWQRRDIADNPNSELDDPYVGQRAAYVVAGKQNSGHMMTFVGYNDDIWIDINGNGQIDPGELGAFKLANSWGTNDWNRGYRWVAYDAMFSQSQVAGWDEPSGRSPACRRRQVKYVIVQRHQPTLYGRFSLRHRYRNEVYARLGFTEAGSTEIPLVSARTRSWALVFSGGPYAFDGSNTTCDATFVYDFSELNITPGADHRFWLWTRVSLLGGEEAMTIQNFELLTPQGVVIPASGYDPDNRVVRAAEEGYAWVDATMPVANQFPSSLIASPTENANLPRSHPITITADVDDPDGYIQRVEFWNDSSKIATVTTAPWQVSTSFSSNGTKVLYAIAYDNHGASTRSPARHVLVTDAPPPPPSRSISIACSLSNIDWSILPSTTAVELQQDHTVFSDLDPSVEHHLLPIAAPSSSN